MTKRENVKLRTAVKRWIRAEYAYRFGPRCFQRETGEWLEEAEKQLRFAMTGKKSLTNAAKQLGVDVRALVKEIGRKSR